MTDKEIETKIARAVEKTAPNNLNEILSRCTTQKGAVTYMKKTTKSLRRTLIAACLALAFISGGGGVLYQQSYAEACVVSLDVNPSIELRVNRNEKVLSCTGLNDAAGQVLSDMGGGADLKGAKLNVAVNAIVGALVSNGYLEDISSAILISVESKDQNQAARLRQELTACVDSTLQSSAAQAAVLSQTVKQDAALAQQATANHISTGKAYLVEQVIQNNQKLADNADTRAALSALSVEELRDMSRRSDVPHLPVDKSQVAQDVLDYAGLSGLAPLRYDVDPELDEPIPHYEVEVAYNGREYDYTVHAFTGEILSGPKDVLTPAAPATPATPATPSTPSTPTTPPVETKQLTQAQAFDLAAADFYGRFPELSGSNILNNTVKLDRDDGRSHYDVEFWISSYEVDYEIDAVTGAVLEWSSEYEGPAPKPDPVPTPQPDPKPQPPAAPATGGDIGRDGAKAAALKHAGLTEGQVSRLQVERDMDDGRLEYEVEFKSGGMEYEYTIDGASGAVLEHEKDRDD